jgi:uncharacterized protein YneF (UPF0154 family)
MADEIPETLFEIIYNRAPTDADRKRLRGVKTGLGLSDRDELWAIIMVLDHYAVRIYLASKSISASVDNIPSETKAAITESMANMGKVFSHRNERSIAHAIDGLETQILQSMRQESRAIADRFNRKLIITVASVVSVISIFFITVGGFGGYWITTQLFEMCISDRIVKMSDGRSVCLVR